MRYHTYVREPHPSRLLIGRWRGCLPGCPQAQQEQPECDRLPDFARRLGPAGDLHCRESVVADFVADNTANGGPTNRSDSTATREDGPADGSDTGTDSCVSVL